jgi:hypothetical protein
MDYRNQAYDPVRRSACLMTEDFLASILASILAAWTGDQQPYIPLF